MPDKKLRKFRTRYGEVAIFKKDCGEGEVFRYMFTVFPEVGGHYIITLTENGRYYGEEDSMSDIINFSTNFHIEPKPVKCLKNVQTSKTMVVSRIQIMSEV